MTLYILTHHNLNDAILDRIKAVKTKHMPGDTVQPHRAAPGSPGPILAFEQVPPWACDYALITAQTSDDGLYAALKHCIGIEVHPRGKTMADWFSAVLEGEVKEVDVPRVPD